ncbi:MAG: argininosuccinate lyase [Rhodospirillaceae bacterium]|nr:argininosuccinate lyase [Rhodospirillaceae bacterium]
MLGHLLAALAAMVVFISVAEAAEDIKDATRIGRSAATARAPEYQELRGYDAQALSLGDAAFPYETQIHRAHIVMLREQGIITPAEAKAILNGLIVVDAQASRDAKLRVYLEYEAALIKAVGHVAGKMHTGRSRNDLVNTENRMFYREQINRVIESLIDLRFTLQAKARTNLDTIMVVYTHRKQAQPITLAHYLMAIDESIGKSIQRYEELYARMNLNPLGSAASAGTGFPLKRERTTELLGFEGLVVNTIEGTAAWDHIAEFATDNVLYMTTLSRLASEIQLWSSDEYGLVELDPAFAGTSSIMPQKQNPESLEIARRTIAGGFGAMVSILTSMHAIEYQHSAARVALEPRAIDAVVAVTHSMSGVVRTLRVNKERMAKGAREGFAVMTELTDTLVRESGISFRDAHEIIAHVVDQTIAQGKTAQGITVPMIEAAAQAHMGARLGISEAAVKAALDPEENVSRRNGLGGPAPRAVQAMIEGSAAISQEQRARLDIRRAHLRDAADTLDRAVAEIVP